MFTTKHVYIRIIRLGLAMACMGLAACQSLPEHRVHPSEMAEFTPLPPSQRIMNTVKLRWEVREDVAAFCASASGMDKERAYTTPPLACAIWSRATRECTLVTGPRTTHLALGHEVRHCFEGHFHH